MTTRKKTPRGSGYNDARAFLEKLTGGPMTFGRMLRSIRECEEWTQEHMATRLGVTKAHVSDIEQGRKAVSPSRAARYAKVLGYSEKQFVRLALQDLLEREGVKMKVVVEAA